MHGRLKVKTTEEQEEARRIEQGKKLKIYKACTSKIFAKRENEEYDEEGLSLTKEILQKNPDFYTLWNYRREILLLLKSQKTKTELEVLGSSELELIENCLRMNSKSYNTWHHRSWLMEHFLNPDWIRELKLCKLFLDMDGRNFHCWDYRRFILHKCNSQPKDELIFTTHLIEKNFSNYSAWHHRSKLLPILFPGLSSGTIDEETMLKEYEIVQNAAFTDPCDQSVWFYHRWLLGRGTKCFEIQSISVLAELQTVIVLLTHPIKVFGNNLKLLVNNVEMDTTWIAADGEESKLWYCKLSSDVCMWTEGCEISVQAVHGTEKSSSKVSVNGIQHHVRKATANSNIFCIDLSAATKDVLQRELESCEQLTELEPENKWTLFTSVLLMRAIDKQKYDPTVMKYLEQLTVVDSMRACYYRDLRSKFLIENYIENMPVDTQELSLSNKKLTSLYHFEQFYFMKTVDLSCNQLTSLYPLRYLLHVEILVLDGNKICSCNELRVLSTLKELSVKNNYIKSIADIELLQECKGLQQLNLAENPIAEIPNFKKVVEDLLGVTLLNV